MLNVEHLRKDIIRPVLETLGKSFSSLAAENLLLGTAVQESGLRHLVQLNGPALGLFQCEPATLDDIYVNYLRYNKGLMIQIDGFRGVWPSREKSLVGNLYYATAICRIHYYRVKSPLPAHDDIKGLGEYWKNHYNTVKGRGTVAQFVLNYKEHVDGH